MVGALTLDRASEDAMSVANVEMVGTGDSGAAPSAEVSAVERRGALATLTWGGALIAVLAGYALLLWAYWAPAIVHPDANGYWAQGSLLMTTGRTWFRPESNAQYIGMHWLV